jgi:hypothetical protein
VTGRGGITTTTGGTTFGGGGGGSGTGFGAQAASARISAVVAAVVKIRMANPLNLKRMMLRLLS